MKPGWTQVVEDARTVLLLLRLIVVFEPDTNASFSSLNFCAQTTITATTGPSDRSFDYAPAH